MAYSGNISNGRLFLKPNHLHLLLSSFPVYFSPMRRQTHIDVRTAYRVGFALACSCFLPPLLLAQESPLPGLPQAVEMFELLPAKRDTTFLLRSRFVAAGTDTVVADSLKTKLARTQYILNFRAGTLRLDTAAAESLFRASAGRPVRLVVSYQYFPFRFQDSYGRRILVLSTDSIRRADSIRVVRPTSAFTVDEIFGPNIQKSGSIVRGFTIGSNQDITLNSGLRLQLAGKITSDVEIAASLTDENTPIQPEGTTQTLQEFDKVFVEIRSTDLAATLGDFTLDFAGTEFARLSRKLQGAKGTAAYRVAGIDGATTVSGAVTRGKFTTKQFNGIEGVQGPYLLTGANNEQGIIIIAGTERVFVDGEPQTRGETNDYIMDYSTGELTFATRRLITSASRITIDFEYTDRQFARSLFAGQSTAGFWGNRGKLSVVYMRETDDPEAPVDFVYTDSARAAMANAGDDPSKAVLSGVTRVDSNGIYVQIDTLLAGGLPAQFYRYDPGNPQAHYIVTFSSVGAGKGEYIRQQAGVFVWKGPGGGEYLPITLLPLPTSHQLLDIALTLSPAEHLRISGEYGRTVFDGNRLSAIDDADNGGNAFTFAAAYDPRNVRIGGLDIGGFDLRLKERFVDSRFVPVDRVNDIEFNRRWGVDTLAEADEEIQEASLLYRPMEGLSAGGGYGSIRRGDLQRSTRKEGTFLLQRPDVPAAIYNVEQITSTDKPADTKSDWLRQKGSVDYMFWKLTPGIRYEGERRTITSESASLLLPGSFAFDAVTAAVNLQQLGPLAFRTEFGWRADDVFKDGVVTPESRSFTQTYGARLNEWNALWSMADVTLRNKTYAEVFQQEGRQDIQTVLVRSHTRYGPLNRGVETEFMYEVATEQASRLERVYVRVAPGAGNYRYLGDLNNNGIADDNEFVLTRFDGDFVVLTLPTDELTPVIDLKTSVRLRLSPKRFITPASTWESILAALSTETYVRIDEKSTEEDLSEIYLLHLSKFQQEATTLSGSSLFTQDLNVFEGSLSFSARLRYSERRGLTNLSGGIEEAYNRERSIRLRWQLVPEIANQLDYINRIDRVSSAEATSRVRDILGNAISFDLSYRPEQNVEVGMKFDVARTTDRFMTPELDADLNAQTVRAVYAFQGAGQMRLEAAREEVLLGREEEQYPYELTGGRVPGKTWLWRVSFDYRVTQFLQATVNYDGRTEGGRLPVHTARAEVRAFF